MVGPSPLQQHRTCVAGLPCFGGDMVGFPSEVHPEGILAVLTSCSSDSVPIAPDGFPNDGYLQLGPVGMAVTAPGGRYQLCWCSTEGTNISAGESSCARGAALPFSTPCRISATSCTWPTMQQRRGSRWQVGRRKYTSQASMYIYMCACTHIYIHVHITYIHACMHIPTLFITLYISHTFIQEESRN